MRTYYLRTLRRRRCLTQEQLERLSGIAQNTISKLESNRHASPIFSTVNALAIALRVQPQQLRFGPDPKADRVAATLATEHVA